MTTEPERGESPADNGNGAEKDWWDRTFDNGPAAKKGCIWSIFGIAAGSLAIIIMTNSRPGDDFKGDYSEIARGQQIAAENVARQKAALEAKFAEMDRADGNYFEVKVAGESNIKAMLKDEDSAEFRNEFVSRLDGGNLMLCGQVNSKNSFGAYTGYSRFIASPNPNAPSLIEGEAMGGLEAIPGAFAEAYAGACGNRVKSF